MAHRKTHAKTAEPVIRFGGEWIPAHDLWEQDGDDQRHRERAIERFNKEFPHLTSSHSRDVVPLVRQRLKDIDLRMPDEDAQPDLAQVGSGCWNPCHPNRPSRFCATSTTPQMDIAQLINWPAKAAYVSALLRARRT